MRVSPIIVLLSALSSPLSADSAITLESSLEAVLEEHQFSGVVRLERPGRPAIERARGLASRELRVPNVKSTRFKLHSLSKPFTSVAVLRSVKEGKLALDESICEWLRPCAESWRPVTVRQLSRHTSGIPDFSNLLADRFDTNLATTLEALAPEFETLGLDFEAGTSWRYSNTGFVLLARILEIVHQVSFAEVLETHVFGPAGLTRTTTERPPPAGGYDGSLVIEGLASGYNGSAGHAQRSLSKMYVIPGAGGIVSTVGDVARFSAALFEGELLPETLLDEMLALDPAMEVRAGLGVFVVEREGLGTVVQHDGGNNGYVSSWQHLPNSGVTLVIVSNEGFTDIGSIRAAILELEAGRRP